ncbi:hypothetical protein FGIG_09629 [Fasciola gigantica]|uniref:Uncharacterized protein n=1 Tax=Fasciola gigantica TaxID=46835 RepID=A0A504YKC5_FASGI|nr:hypothetical protein FGIG_09629 [Fasciola gigantica]
MMPQRMATNKRLQPSRKKDFIFGYYRLVREATRGTTYEGHPLDAHLEQINAYLDKQQFRYESELSETWTIESVNEKLEWLDRFGQLFIKHSESKVFHFSLDQVIPVTNLWDGYVYGSDQSKHLDPAAQVPFAWDLYVLIRRPIKCTLCPGWDAGSEPGAAQFFIEIPPPLSTSNQLSPDHSDSDDENPSMEHSCDPYELVRKTRTIVRQSWSKKSGKPRTETTEQHLIDPGRTVTVMCEQLIPTTLNSIMKGPENYGIDLKNWRPLGRTDKHTTDTFELQLNVRLLDEIGQSTHGETKLTREKSPGSNPGHREVTNWSGLSTQKISPSSEVNLHPIGRRQPMRQICLQVRFIPVYSMNDLLSKNPFLLRSHRCSGNPRLVMQNHTLLRPGPSSDQSGTECRWQVCTRLADQAQLALLDLADKGQRRAAVRLIYHLFQISDLTWKTNFLHWMEPQHLNNITLHATNEESDQSNQKIWTYLSDLDSKPVVWQRAPLTLIVLHLLRYTYNALQELRLPTFNGIATNLFLQPADERQRKQLSVVRSVLGAWVKSEAALRQILEIAVKQTMDYSNTIHSKIS